MDGVNLAIDAARQIVRLERLSGHEILAVVLAEVIVLDSQIPVSP